MRVGGGRSGFVFRAALCTCTTLALFSCGGERVLGAGERDGGALFADGGPTLDAGVMDAGRVDAGGELGDGGAALADGGVADAGGDGGAACRPDGDGVLQAREVPFVVGATASFVTNQDGTVAENINTGGRDGGAGLRIWDFSAAHPQDHRVLDEVQSPAGKWWSSAYPAATFAVLIDRVTGLLGVYAHSASALRLLGTVSTEANRTNVRLDPAVDVLRFPLSVGQSWQVTSTGAGFFNFTPLTNTNVYRFSVDARGEVWTPAARFPSLRLRMDLEQSIPLTLFRRSSRTFVFLSECWGTVARVTSVDDDVAMELTRASEYRRLAP